MSSMRRW